MTFDEPTRWIATRSRSRQTVSRMIQMLSSLKLTVVLLVTLATVIAIATVLETNHGRQHAQWFVYHSPWFVGLLVLLGANVLCAALVRWPWKPRQAGLIITHGGLLMLLAGSIQTIYGGIEGQIELVEGEATDQMTLSQRDQLTANWADEPHEAPYVFTFESGPVDWSAGMHLDVGNVDGVGARVLNYYQHGQLVEDWTADDRGLGGPLLRFQLEGSQGGQRVEHFLIDQDFGCEVFLGPMAFRLQRATDDAMLDDFLRPAGGKLGEHGLLTMYYQNHVQRERVDDVVGKTIAVGDDGATVELVQYLANPKLDGAGQFQSTGEVPRNPAVELRVRLPGDDQPYRQVAFAKSPLLNLDGVYARTCPVKFVYRHPAIAPAPAVEFMQSRDGKLHCRTISGGEFKPHGELTNGSRVEAPGKLALTVTEYLPHARCEVSFKPASRGRGDYEELEPAAQVEISAAGTTETMWLERNHPERDHGTIDTAEGPLHVRFTDARMPLGFSLRLVDVRRGVSGGQAGNATHASIVRLIDEELHVDEEREISMNRPLTHRGLTLSQSSLRDAGHGKEAAVFNVVHDPGHALKYAGSLLVCLGVSTMFCLRADFFQGFPQLWTGRSQPPHQEQAMSEDDIPGELRISA